MALHPDGVIQIENGASINNAGTFEIQNDSFLFGGMGVATFFKNTGTLVKSADEQFDIATDIFLGAVSIDDVQTPLAPGESYTITEAVTIPSTAADSQFLLFVTDENNDELETSKSNNVFAEAVQFPTGLIVNLDVNNNGQTDALTDGSLIMRYLFGFGGDTLINGSLGPDADRTTASEIINYLDAD
ncbi:MAG: hypothetical protein GDA43_05175 [Hormoscilla sp. SP5CHS1]|nr:hypothetical protein [Hormoscilla sp. SP12CHS1]MBC6452659.1 hypothetical protein [Hormoscilla sp. SP5CHS1]